MDQRLDPVEGGSGTRMRGDRRAIRWHLALLPPVLAAILCAALQPFDVHPPNAVGWIRGSPGLSFRGAGMILSLFDGRIAPSLLVGVAAGRIFLFSRHEVVPESWTEQFSSSITLQPGATRFVAATYDEREKAIFADGALLERRSRIFRKTAPRDFSGRLVLGNSPSGARGWWGRIRGLAIYRRALTAEEISRHGSAVKRHGVGVLVGEEDLLALYPFDEGTGDRARSPVPGSPALRIPARFSGLPRSLLRVPGDDPRLELIDARDLLQNLALFLPLGLLLGSLLRHTTALGRARIACRVAVAGAALSLGIELTQLWMPARLPSTLDVLANTLGAGLGGLMGWRLPGCSRRPAPHS